MVIIVFLYIFTNLPIFYYALQIFIQMHASGKYGTASIEAIHLSICM